MNFLLLYYLVFTHILADFILQPNSWVVAKRRKKHKSWQLYIHALIAGCLAALVCIYEVQSLNYWWVLFAIAIPHFCIDLWKVNQQQTVNYFKWDQYLHVINLILVWGLILLEEIGYKSFININTNYYLHKILLVGSGVLLLGKPAGIIVGKLTENYRKMLNSADKDTSIPKAGEIIGILERLFIFLFILLNQFTAIGFLIAAKSILRFSDHKRVENPIRMSEYIIIGTLMSFLIAVLVGLTVNYFL